MSWKHMREHVFKDFISKDYISNIYTFYKHYGLFRTLKGASLVFLRRGGRLLVNLTKEHVVEVVNGYKITTIPFDKGISLELLLFKVHEPLLTEIIKRELKKGMICLDIGANIGYYSILECMLVKSEGKVIAVEPSPVNFLYLMKNIRLNGCTNIETYNFAFSSSDGENFFLLDDEQSNLSRIVIEGNFPRRGKIIRVQTKSIDSFFTQYYLEGLDFLRADVEGHEVEIIRGGMHTLKKFKPKLAIELHKKVLGLRKTIGLLQILQDLGYRIKYFIPRELDKPLIASTNDIIEEIDFAQLIYKLLPRPVHEAFNIVLE